MSRRYTEVEAAFEWTTPIHIWETYPEEARAEMIALVEVRSKRQAYEQHLADREREAAERQREAKKGFKGRR